MNFLDIHFPRTACFTALALTVLTFVPTLVAAQPPGHGHFGGPHRFLSEQLDLTPEQEQAIREIRDAHRDTLEPQFQAFEDTRKALDDQIHAENLDEGAIAAAVDQLSQAQLNLALTRAAMHQEIRQVLTPEQQARLLELHENGGPFGRRHGHGRRGGHGGA